MRTFTAGISDNSAGLGQTPRVSQTGNVYPAIRFYSPPLIPRIAAQMEPNAGKVRRYHSCWFIRQRRA